MATVLKTPTRIVSVSLKTEDSVDWSSDYVGNHHDANLVRDRTGEVDYLTDDATADWWVKQCAAQQEADDALAALSAADRQTVLADPRLNVDLEDQPGAVMSAIGDLASGQAVKESK